MNTGLTFKSIKCKEVGHLIGDCDKSRFKSRIPPPPKENLEAGKPVHDSSTAWEDDAATTGQDAATAEHDAGTADHDATTAENDTATGEHDDATAEHDVTSAEHDDATGNSGEDVTSASSYGSGNGVETQSWD